MNPHRPKNALKVHVLQVLAGTGRWMRAGDIWVKVGMPGKLWTSPKVKPGGQEHVSASGPRSGG